MRHTKKRRKKRFMTTTVIAIVCHLSRYSTQFVLSLTRWLDLDPLYIFIYPNLL